MGHLTPRTYRNCLPNHVSGAHRPGVFHKWVARPPCIEWKRGQELKSGKKWPKTAQLVDGPKWEQKWPPFSTFPPFFGPFFPISGHGPFHFRPNLSQFRLSARFPILHQAPWLAVLEHTFRKCTVPQWVDCQGISFAGIPLDPSKRTEKLFSGNVRVGFWQNGFVADFYFWASGFFCGFCRRISCSHFCGKKVPRKILQENPRQKSFKFYTTKIPTTSLQRGRAKKYLKSCNALHDRKRSSLFFCSMTLTLAVFSPSRRKRHDLNKYVWN